MSDKPLRGPSRPLGFAVDDFDYIKPSEIPNVSSKPMRGHTSPSVHWDDFTFVEYPDRIDLPKSTVVVDKQQNALIIPPLDGPLLLTYNPSHDPCFYDKYMSQLVGAITKQVGIAWENYRSDAWSSENIERHVNDVFNSWVEKAFGKNRSFYSKYNYGRIPSKKDGRKGTRRAWKRAHPPKKVKWTWLSPGHIQSDQSIHTVTHTVTVNNGNNEKEQG